ncbi:hypothetical protein FB593_1011425 [Rhizobium sp. SJZ105]|nr:hypothetical protein FB593_1011425 [Rhizobium sp. SJZ105]
MKGVGHFLKKHNHCMENSDVQYDDKPLISFKISGPAWGTIIKKY